MNQAIKASMLFASPAMAEIVASWIEDGTAARIVEMKRAEVASRQRIARRIFGERIAGADVRSPHVTLDLPRRWTADAFAEEARRRRVRVTSASAFAITEEAPRAIRICLGAPATAAELESGLSILAAIDEERTETPLV